MENRGDRRFEEVHTVTETVFRLKRGLTSFQIMILGFAGVILLGALVLMLPIAAASRTWTPFHEALFTSTSAVCVTGLVVQDTGSYWSGFGQTVILLLIQVGGLGVITAAVTFLMLSGRNISLKERSAMQDAISAPAVGGIVRLTRFILKGTFLVELVGALALLPAFCRDYGLRGVWMAIFHSVSAFCNAGFDLMGDKAAFSSLTDYTGDPVINAAVCLLIVLGGLGFLVWQDVAAHRWHVNRYRLQSKLVLSTTALLLVGGGLFYGLYEFAQPQWADLSGQERGLAALFQSVSPRTAGFNTVDLTLLSAPTLLVTILLMLAGGSPGSTAGGVKTTTLAVLFLAVLGVFRRQSGASAFGRRLPEVVIRNACALFVLYLTLFLTGGLLLCCVEGIPLMSALFEAASAIGTVGLTLGVTTELSSFGQLILIFLMYFGRVGGLTMIYAMTARPGGPASQYPQEQVTVG